MCGNTKQILDTVMGRMLSFPEAVRSYLSCNSRSVFVKLADDVFIMASMFDPLSVQIWTMRWMSSKLPFFDRTPVIARSTMNSASNTRNQHIIKKAFKSKSSETSWSASNQSMLSSVSVSSDPPFDFSTVCMTVGNAVGACDFRSINSYNNNYYYGIQVRASRSRLRSIGARRYSVHVGLKTRTTYLRFSINFVV